MSKTELKEVGGGGGALHAGGLRVQRKATGHSGPPKRSAVSCRFTPGSAGIRTVNRLTALPDSLKLTRDVWDQTGRKTRKVSSLATWTLRVDC